MIRVELHRKKLVMNYLVSFMGLIFLTVIKNCCKGDYNQNCV